MCQERNERSRELGRRACSGGSEINARKMKGSVEYFPKLSYVAGNRVSNRSTRHSYYTFSKQESNLKENQKEAPLGSPFQKHRGGTAQSWELKTPIKSPLHPERMFLQVRKQVVADVQSLGHTCSQSLFQQPRVGNSMCPKST